LATAAGWSSPVARQAHNLKVVGSNPTPATKYKIRYKKTRIACGPCADLSQRDGARGDLIGTQVPRLIAEFSEVGCFGNTKIRTDTPQQERKL
jgi:hypothetical protein